MSEVNGNTDLVEFSNHIPQMEGKEISQFKILELQVDAFTTLFANEPRQWGQRSGRSSLAYLTEGIACESCDNLFIFEIGNFLFEGKDDFFTL